MSKAVLHIGTHKTATTLIQDAFANNRGILGQHNIVYPTVGQFNGHHILASEWVDIGKQYKLPNGTEKIWRYLIDVCADGGKTMVLSSEEFSRAAPTQVNMVELRERLAPFDQVEIVCFLRDQKSFLQSVYLEISKNRPPHLPTEMHQQAIDTHLADGLYLDYNKLYDHLLTGFSKDEITFVPFGATVGHDGGILGYFLKMLGFGLSHEALSLDKVSSNTSEDALTMWAANAIAAPSLASNELLESVYKALQVEFGTPLKTDLFTEKEAIQLKAVFDPLNQQFCARIAHKQPHFKFAPIRTDEKLPNRDDIAAQFWLKLLRQAYRKSQN
jgi:hypothetical protein